MAEVVFCEDARSSQLTWAAVAARWDGQWLFVRTGDRWELPKQQREEGETIFQTADRLLREELDIPLSQTEPVSALLIPGEWEDAQGALFFAEVGETGSQFRQRSEQGDVGFFSHCSADTGGTDSQLLDRAEKWLAEGNFRPVWEDLFEVMC